MTSLTITELGHESEHRGGVLDLLVNIKLYQKSVCSRVIIRKSSDYFYSKSGEIREL